MHFAPDTVESLECAVALANTTPSASRSGADELVTLDQLGVILRTFHYSGRIDSDDRELRDVRQTRDRLRGFWFGDRDEAVHSVNQMLREANALPQLARHDEYDWHLHATAPTAPLAERIRVEVCIALIDVFRMEATNRLRVCEAEDCAGVLVDFSRNASKRFCSIRCGNRVNMIAFRERNAAEL